MRWQSDSGKVPVGILPIGKMPMLAVSSKHGIASSNSEGSTK